MGDLTHLDAAGRPRMVDVAHKPETLREATARGEIRMRRETLRRIQEGTVAKGDVLAVAQLAGIQAAKRTWELIPLCHLIPLAGLEISFRLDEARSCVEIRATARAVARTGVEMEALVAVMGAALAIYDMCKALDREMVITDVWLERKTGGRSGTFERGHRTGEE
ncbi:MAG: cyclic pyranopterin monophosphate synthase MoaC [Armatimonadota bacterium]|nr:cyclic pyranopterin monophosphate synthase MoaC [Armatimonadota bacterium]MDR7445271.1 cyclic pyranopterin monophosphate synthase MoaC [Armatimonadota bacterium]MDR7570993.1 cyclic pyranopterin monophosphate synthase MoaC [Armatimonadota bacterium]MDR7614738.1 cyclic pyranopterin monophosphate synthase MoaC [Armatimonadota bacterium]